MRIALCLSGQPRFLSKCLPIVKKCLIEPNSADVFVHTWWDPIEVGNFNDTSISSQETRVGVVESEVPEKIQSLNPIKFEIDLPRNFEIASTLTGSPSAKPNSLCSNFYSQHRAIQMKAEHERDHSFTYDAVIRARLDLWYEGEIKISEIPHDLKEFLVLASIWQDKRQVNIPCLGDYTMDDNFAVSSSENMDIYGQVFSNMAEINKLIYPPYAENYLGWNCKIMNKMKVETCNFPVEITQRIIHNERTA